MVVGASAQLKPGEFMGSVGIASDNNSLFSVTPFARNTFKNRAILLRNQARADFKLAKLGFGNESIPGQHDVMLCVAALTPLHKSFELSLKALLYLKGIDVVKGHKHHDLGLLLKDCLEHYPVLQVIDSNFLNVLGSTFSSIRHAEGVIFFKNTAGETNSDPLSELCKVSDLIFEGLTTVLENEIKQSTIR